MDVFSYDLLFVPVHLGTHWCLAVVDFAQSGIYYFDSMYMKANYRARVRKAWEAMNAMTALCKYLREEHWDKKGEKYSTDGFQV